MPWYLSPIKLARAAGDVRDVLSRGGPTAVRVTGISPPEGLIVPTATVSLEVDRMDGTVARFAPEVPVPWPYAWTYRLARRLSVPVVSDVDPQRVRFGVPLPRGGSGGRR